MADADVQNRAMRLLQAGRADEAADLLLAARETADARLDAVLALALQYAGRTGPAVDAYRRAIAHARQQLAGLCFNLGTALSAERRLDEAAATYADALALAPDLHVARMNLATIRHQQGRLDEAETELRRVIAADPDDVRARTNLGAVLCAQRRFSDAEAELAVAATSDDPEAARALAGLAVALTAQGRHPEAIAAARAGCARDPELAEAHEQLAAAAFAARDHALTVEAATRAAELEDSAQVQEFLGAGLAGVGRHEEAALAFARSAELAPGNSSPLRNLATVLDNLADRDGAIAAWRKVLALEPDDATAWQQLAGVLARKGEVAEAIAIFERLLADSPDDVSIQHSLASLRGDQPAAPPPGYVAGLFDQYAPRFDKHLVDDLGYVGHLALREALGETRVPRAIDLGCGTGLVGALIRPLADHLTGVDLSPRMIDTARGKDVYDELAIADVVAYLDQTDASFDLFTCADVLIYIGDPVPLFDAVARRIAPGGRFAFTVERGDHGAWHLDPSGRYSHDPAHLEALAAARSLSVASRHDVILRYEQKTPVPAIVYVMERAFPT